MWCGLSKNAQFDYLAQRSGVIRGNNRWGKRLQNAIIAFFSDTFDDRNLKLGTVVVCDVGFPKMYTLMTFHGGQRSSGAIMGAKMGIFHKIRNFFSYYGGCMNETGHAYRKDMGLVCCIMFAHLTDVKGHQGP